VLLPLGLPFPFRLPPTANPFHFIHHQRQREKPPKYLITTTTRRPNAVSYQPRLVAETIFASALR
jgi:hypothetical protein